MKRVALINDLSGFGKCSLTAGIPVISVMGMQACPLPTAILSAQTGFKDYFCDDFTDRMDYITEKWKAMGVSFDGICSGYLSDSLQIGKVSYFLEQFQKEDTLYLADPVMGDHGRPYGMFSEEFLKGMKQLTLKADIITPNLTELCLLADENYEKITKYRHDKEYIHKIETVCEKLLKKSAIHQTIIVTGIIRSKEGKEYIGNLAFSAKESYYLETVYSGVGFSGTGDLFASVICGSLVKGLSVQEAIEKAVYFLQGAIIEAAAENAAPAHGVCFEKYLSRLI